MSQNSPLARVALLLLATSTLGVIASIWWAIEAGLAKANGALGVASLLVALVSAWLAYLQLRSTRMPSQGATAYANHGGQAVANTGRIGSLSQTAGTEKR